MVLECLFQGTNELGPSERRVTMLLLSITLAHMLLTIPARVSHHSVPSSAIIPWPIKAMYVIVQHFINAGCLFLRAASSPFPNNADIVKPHCFIGHQYPRGFLFLISIESFPCNKVQWDQYFVVKVLNYSLNFYLYCMTNLEIRFEENGCWLWWCWT